MNFNKIRLLSYTLIIFIFISCESRKNIVYFQGSQADEEVLYSKYTPKIQADDLLIITVSAMDLKSTLPFNLQNPYQTLSGSDNANKTTYLVDEEGYIDYPVLGKIKLGGLTRAQAMDQLKRDLKKYIVDPGVNIAITNFKITVLGEVNKPGTYTLNNERVTVLEALGMAGDLTIKGVRKNVMVIREVDGKLVKTNVDLTSSSALASPVYFLSQNDVVYVEPNSAEVQSAKYSQYTGVFISVAGLIITVISVLTR